MKSKSIKDETNQNIIYPLIVNFIVVAVIISFLVFAVDNQHVEKIKSYSFDFNTNTLNDVSNTIGLSFQNDMNNHFYNLYTVNSVLQDCFNKKLTCSPGLDPYANPNSYINALLLALNGPDSIVGGIPGYDTTSGISLFKTMWYISRDLSDITQSANLQGLYESFTGITPLFKSLYSSNKLSQIISVAYETSAADQKLYSMYPLNNDFPSFAKILTKGPWDIFTSQTAYTTGEVAFLQPYNFKDSGYVFVACIPNAFDTTSTLTGSNINCVNYQLPTLKASLIAIQKDHGLTCFIVEKTKFNIILHSNMDNIHLEEGAVNITQVEFYGHNYQSSELIDFIAKLKTLTGALSSTNNFMTFIKNGKTMVLVLKEVTVKTGTTTQSTFLVGVIQAQSTIYNYFESLSSGIIKHAKIQVAGVAIILVVMSLFYYFLSRKIDRLVSGPIEDLTKFGKNIYMYWSAKNEDYLLGVEDISISVADGDNTQIPSRFSSFREIRLVYDNFSQVMTMVRYSKEAQDSLNDPEALTNYSQALKIYEKLEHTKGMSSTYTNIARLHQKNGRLDEATFNFEKAIETTRKELEKLRQVASDRILERNNQKRRLRKKIDENDEEIQEDLDQMERNLRLDLNSKLYEYGKCLLQKKQKARSRTDKATIVQNLKINFTEIITNDKELGKTSNRLVSCLLILLNIMVEQNDFANIKAKFQETETILKNYKDDYDKNPRGEDKTSLIPPPIFRQNIVYLRGLYSRKIGQKKEACRLFTEALEAESLFDPNVRRKCLLELQELFKNMNKLEEAPQISKLLTSFIKKPKDIVILLDCSQSMGQGIRMRTMVNNLLKLFDHYLKPTDRIGYLTFNLNCDVVFMLSEKKKNTNQLRKLLEVMPRPAGGTAMFNAIQEGMRLIDKAEPRNNTKWILALIDGDDNESRISYEQIYKKLAKADVNLGVIGLALNQVAIAKMNYLCKATPDGVFVESPSEDKLSEAFSMMFSVLYGQDFELEDLTFDL